MSFFSCCGKNKIKQKPRVLFLLKKRDNSWNDCSYSYSGGFSSGLYNSARFVKDMLIKNNIEATLIECVDNNEIDKFVTFYKPTHVVLEAVWVVPEKMDVLTKLHPNVKWIIRNHSDFSFLSTEGIIIDWMHEYIKYPNVYVSNNKSQTNEDFKHLIEQFGENPNKVVYLPNYYPEIKNCESKEKDKNTLNICCFGAVRALKNPVIQAIAAIKFSNSQNKTLNFHINGGRLENQGESVLKSLVSLFKHNLKHKLIQHPWLPHDKFLELCSSMDIGLQVSHTETFCIVAADLVSVNIPIVVSKEIFWAHDLFKADCTNSEDICQKLSLAWNLRHISNFLSLNKRGLKKYSLNSEKIWIKFLRN